MENSNGIGIKSQQLMRTFLPSKIPRPKKIDCLPLSFPAEIEIGAGVGLHAIQRCLSNPDIQLVAIEKTKKKYEKMKRRWENNGAPQNLKLVHAEARAWVAHFVPPQSLTKIYILYPNPSPKNRAQRWSCMPFMNFLWSRLKIGAEVILATNLDWYAQEVVRYWSKNDLLIRKQSFDENSLKGRSHFEKKYLKRGETVYYVRAQKI